MSVFEFSQYKKFVKHWVESLPKKGRGTYAEMARLLSTNSVTISQIFKGNRQLSPEQAIVLCDFFDFAQLERDYFIALVHFERAGTTTLKSYYGEQIKVLKEKSQEVRNRVQVQSELDENAKARFYSNWYYSGIRLLAGRKDIHTAKDIAGHTHLNRSTINDALEFLIRNNLVIETPQGLDVGMQSTHLGHLHPLINSHRKNWRLRGLEKISHNHPTDLFYSGPMVLSEELVTKVRERLLEFIGELTQELAQGDREKTACLNIDWYEF